MTMQNEGQGGFEPFTDRTPHAHDAENYSAPVKHPTSFICLSQSDNESLNVAMGQIPFETEKMVNRGVEPRTFGLLDQCSAN